MKWTNAGGAAQESAEESRVILDIGYYGKVDKEDGWLITELNSDGDAAMGEVEFTVEEQMHWSAIKAEFLCPKM